MDRSSDVRVCLVGDRSGVCVCVCRLGDVISLCGRTYQTETAMWGDMFYSATITLDPPVTLVLHGLLPLHSVYNIHVLLHNI